jgi:hypothetical protein
VIYFLNKSHKFGFNSENLLVSRELVRVVAQRCASSARGVVGVGKKFGELWVKLKIRVLARVRVG